MEKGKVPAALRGEAPNSADGQIAQRNREMKISNGKLTGRQILSRQDGLVIETESQSTMDVGLTKGGQPQTIHMVIKTKLTRTTKPDIKPRKKRPVRKTALEQAKTVKAQTDTRLIASAVRMFYVRNSKLPNTLKELTKKDGRGRSELESMPNDGWGQAYKLVPGATPRELEVVSAGPDKKHGTADDISSRRKRR